MFKRKSKAMWVGASQIALLISNFLLLKLLSSQLSVESFGYYSLCMSIVLFARQILYDPISIVIAKECAISIPNYGGASNGFRVVRYLTERIGLALLLFGFLLLFFSCVLSVNYINRFVIFSCFFYLCANGAQGIYFNVLNSIGERKPAAVFSIFDSILKIALVFTAFQLIGKTLGYTLVPISFGAFAIFLGLRLFIKHKFEADSSSQREISALVKRALLMSAPLYLPTVFTAIKSVGDRWILAAFMGVDDLAAFTVLLQLGYLPMLLIIGVAQTIVAPTVYRLCSIRTDKGFGELSNELKKYLLRIFVFTCASTGVALGISNWIFQILIGKDYHIFSNYLPFFVISGALAAIAGMLQLVAIGVFETHIVGRLMIISVVISVLVASLFTAIFGLVGAIIGLLTSSAITVLIYWLALHRVVFKVSAEVG